MRYSDLRAPPPSSYQAGGNSTGSGSSDDGGRLKSIEKDKILRQSPFDACGLILGGILHVSHTQYISRLMKC